MPGQLLSFHQLFKKERKDKNITYQVMMFWSDTD